MAQTFNASKAVYNKQSKSYDVEHHVITDGNLGAWAHDGFFVTGDHLQSLGAMMAMPLENFGSTRNEKEENKARAKRVALLKFWLDKCGAELWVDTAGSPLICL